MVVINDRTVASDVDFKCEPSKKQYMFDLSIFMWICVTNSDIMLLFHVGRESKIQILPPLTYFLDISSHIKCAPV